MPDTLTGGPETLVEHLRMTHKPVRRSWRRPDGCPVCQVDWPCPVDRLLAHIDTLTRAKAIDELFDLMASNVVLEAAVGDVLDRYAAAYIEILTAAVRHELDTLPTATGVDARIMRERIRAILEEPPKKGTDEQR